MFDEKQAFWPCIDSTTTFKAQKCSKDIIKIHVHVTSVVQP